MHGPWEYGWPGGLSQRFAYHTTKSTATASETTLMIRVIGAVEPD